MEFLPWIIIIWAAERKTLQRASICQEPICIFPSCEVLLSLSGWPSDSFHINPHLHDDESFPHCQERAYDFIQPVFPPPDQPETELINPHEGSCTTSTSVTAAHHRLHEKYGKSKRLISMSDLVFLEVLVMSGLHKHNLYLTLSLISNSSPNTSSAWVISFYLCIRVRMDYIFPMLCVAGFVPSF